MLWHGGRLLWDPNEYPVGLSLDIEYWKSVRVNRWSMRINYTYNKKIVNVGIYNTFSFGDVDIHRSGLVAKTGVSLHSAYIGISVRYPVYFSIMNGEFSEFGLDRYVIFTPNVTVRF